MNSYSGRGFGRRPKEKSKADEIFEYLHKVRMEDEDTEYSDATTDSEEFSYPGSRSAVGKLFGGESPVARYIPDKPNITFTSMMPKKSAATPDTPKEDEGFLASIGRVKFSDIDDTVRNVTKSPLIRAGALGLLGAGAMYLAYPWLDSPDADRVAVYGKDEDHSKRRGWITAATAPAIMALAAYSSSHPNIKSSLYKYLPKNDEIIPYTGLKKNSSMLGPADFVPIGFAQKAVMDSPTMTLDNKYRAINMLNAIPGGPNTPVNSTDIVSTAVSTGSSAHGYPVGRATVGAVADALLTYAGASAFGVQNPGGLASKVGLGSLGLRLLGQSF
jgi:hypothetical protein